MDLNRALSQTYESFDKYLFKLKNPVLVVLIVGLILRFILLSMTNVDSWGWYRTGENIISGDQFVADNEKKKWMRETFKAVAVEMESSAAAMVAYNAGIPERSVPRSVLPPPRSHRR